MAGHMGAEKVTTQNLRVVRTDAERGLILIRGAVPGSKGGWVLLSDAVKRRLPEDAPLPGAFRAPGGDAAAAPAEETGAEVPAEEVEAEAEAQATEEPAAEADAPETEASEEASDENKDDA